MSTINLEAKTYKPGDITLSAGNEYVGVPGKTILSFPSGPQGYAHLINGDNFALRGCTLNGGGIFFQKKGGRNTNIVLDNNVFNLNAYGQELCAVTFNSGLSNAKITNNRFTGYQGSFALYGYGYDNLTIANNEFDAITAACHIDSFGGCSGLLFEQNWANALRGMFLELQTQGGTQPSASHVTVQDNWNENADVNGASVNQRKNIMGLSVPLDKGEYIGVRRNYINSTQRPDGVGMVIGIECGGGTDGINATIVEDNCIIGTNDWAAMNDGVGPAYVLLQNNRASGQIKGPTQAHPDASRIFQQITNGPNVALTWDVNRGRPYRNKRYGDPVTPVGPKLMNIVQCYSDGSIKVVPQ